MNLGAQTHFFILFCEVEKCNQHLYCKDWSLQMRHIKFLGFNVRVPAHPILRIGFGVILVLGGLLGFLPILGFWMLPLGLIVLSIDFALVRRWRRKASVRLGRWLLMHYPRIARHIGFGV
jgi:hypothetical protein